MRPPSSASAHSPAPESPCGESARRLLSSPVLSAPCRPVGPQVPTLGSLRLSGDRPHPEAVRDPIGHCPAQGDGKGSGCVTHTLRPHRLPRQPQRPVPGTGDKDQTHFFLYHRPLRLPPPASRLTTPTSHGMRSCPGGWVTSAVTGTPKRAHVEATARLERPRGCLGETHGLRKASSASRMLETNPLCKEHGHGVHCSQEPADRRPGGEARGVRRGRDGGRPG